MMVKKIIPLIVLITTLPLFIWSIVNLTFNIRNKAQDIQRASISIGNSPSIGPVNAPVTIIEFADFQCPFCKMFHDQTLQQILDAYPNKIKFVYKQYPLSFHPDAMGAAEASLCINEQNKFWQMSDLMFANQDNLGIANLKTLAATLGIDSAKFNDCLDSNKYASGIQAEVAQGDANGVVGTPTFFINGIKLNGALPFEAFKQVIDSELALVAPIETPTPTATPLIRASDDVFFIPSQTKINFTSVGLTPNVSVTPTEVNLGTTYVVDVSFGLQNTLKQNYPDLTIPVELFVNGYNLGYTPVSIPLIAEHRDGAVYGVSGVFTATNQVTNVSLVFDPNNIYSENKETNNKLSYDFNVKGEPNSCNGTCGSNYNCKDGLFCSQGFCRNPSCPTDKTCGCLPTATPKATATPITSSTQATSLPEPTFTPSLSPTPYNNVDLTGNAFITLKNPSTATPFETITPESTTTNSLMNFDPKRIFATVVTGLICLYALLLLIKSFKANK